MLTNSPNDYYAISLASFGGLDLGSARPVAGELSHFMRQRFVRTVGPSEPAEPIDKPVDGSRAAQVVRLLSCPSFNQTSPFYLNVLA